MKNAFSTSAYGLLLAVVLFIAGFLVAQCWLTRSHDDFDAAGWAAALGTFVAFAGAIHLASLETRRRTKQEQAKALIRAVRVGVLLVEVMQQIRQLYKKLRALENCNNRVFEEGVLLLKSLELWSSDELMDMSVIEGDLVNRLAIISSVIRTMQYRWTSRDLYLEFAKTERFLRVYESEMASLNGLCHQLDLAFDEQKSYLLSQRKRIYGEQ